jgi:hypothetical protein
MALSPKDYENFVKALDLIGTPRALESLEALTQDGDPYADADADAAQVDHAIQFLVELGAAVISPAGTVTATDRGRVLYQRLVEIETDLKQRKDWPPWGRSTPPGTPQQRPEGS